MWHFSFGLFAVGERLLNLVEIPLQKTLSGISHHGFGRAGLYWLLHK
jgi:hypothetical protein